MASPVSDAFKAMDFLTLVIGLVITLLVYSYLLGDNPLYRVAVHLLVGVSAGYAAVIVIRQVIAPALNQLVTNPTDLDNWPWLIILLFAFLLLFKTIPRLSWMGNSTLAIMVGAGAAVALVGAITGTLWPQIRAASQPTTLGALGALVTALMTIFALFYFQFTGIQSEKTPAWRRTARQVGQFVLTVTFGALFAGVLSTSLALLTYQLGQFFSQLP